MNEELVRRINFCARTLNAFGVGKLMVDATRMSLRFEVYANGRTLFYNTIEDLETFAEHLITNRNRNDGYRAVRRSLRHSRHVNAWAS